MNKETIKEKLRELLEDTSFLYGIGDDMLTSIISIVREMDEWVSVDTEKPPVNVDVYVCNIVTQDTGTAYYNRFGQWAISGMNYFPVTHWTYFPPLPQPPNKVK